MEVLSYLGEFTTGPLLFVRLAPCVLSWVENCRDLPLTPPCSCWSVCERSICSTNGLLVHWRPFNFKIRICRDFECDLGVTVLPVSALICPPHGPSIPLMWAQERYSLYPARWKQNSDTSTATVVWNTIQALRSAAGHFFALDLLTAHPEFLVADQHDQPILVKGCSPTDELAYSHFTAGMKRRVGEHTKPATPLLERHIKWIDDLVERQYTAATTSRQRRKACRIAITNLLGWLAWLRA
jgi:hypothetical protein